MSRTLRVIFKWLINSGRWIITGGIYNIYTNKINTYKLLIVSCFAQSSGLHSDVTLDENVLTAYETAEIEMTALSTVTA